MVASGHPVTEAVAVKSGNLSVQNSLFTGYSTAVARTLGSVNEDYNLYFGGGGTVASYLSGTVTSGGHSLVADPLLANPAAGDYHLTYDSPARDHGLNLGVMTDYEGDAWPFGNRPDIGFDELIGYGLVYLPLVVR